jgi:penicillin-binding protein 2
VYDSKTGLSILAKYSDLYGLSETSGVEIEEYSPKISDTDPIRSAIGQGTNNYTTTQLVRYITTVANRGTCYDLTLIDKVTDSNNNLLSDNKATVRNTLDDIKTSTWNAVHLGMRRVVESKSYFKELNITVAGKTGTAQESKSRANHALFLCFAPYEKPEIAIATRIAFGYSSDYAAQTTKDVLAFYYGVDDDEDIVTGTASDIETGTVSGD